MVEVKTVSHTSITICQVPTFKYFQDDQIYEFCKTYETRQFYQSQQMHRSCQLRIIHSFALASNTSTLNQRPRCSLCKSSNLKLSLLSFQFFHFEVELFGPSCYDPCTWPKADYCFANHRISCANSLRILHYFCPLSSLYQRSVNATPMSS